MDDRDLWAMNGYEQFDIYFDDLNEETQKKLLAFYNILDPIDANLDVIPLAVLTRIAEDFDE